MKRKKESPFPSYDSASILKVRTKLGMTQPEFGAIFGVSRQTVNSWESGKHPITRMRAFQIERDLQRHAEATARQ